MHNRWKPNVTVAAIIEQDGRYLLVEEHTPEGLRLNNPAGHLDPEEGLVQACAREALEETTHLFTPEALVGIYLSTWQPPLGLPGHTDAITYLRFAFSGKLGHVVAGRVLDSGIVRTVWMTPTEVLDSRHLHRSPLVVQCMQDHQRGQRFSLDVIYDGYSW